MKFKDAITDESILVKLLSTLKVLIFHDGAEFKNKLMGVMVYF
jgi:hypothetical protein